MGNYVGNYSISYNLRYKKTAYNVDVIGYFQSKIYHQISSIGFHQADHQEHDFDP